MPDIQGMCPVTEITGVDAGEIPHCVDMCVTEALRFGDEEDFAAEIAAATQVDEGTGPRVYYLNAPGLFIGGEVWNPEPNDVLEGVRVTLTAADGTVAETVTNDWGDFWFNKLAAGSYTVAIQADGYEPVGPIDVQLDKNLNLGDFPLKRA